MIKNLDISNLDYLIFRIQSMNYEISKVYYIVLQRYKNSKIRDCVTKTKFLTIDLKSY